MPYDVRKLEDRQAQFDLLFGRRAQYLELVGVQKTKLQDALLGMHLKLKEMGHVDGQVFVQDCEDLVQLARDLKSSAKILDDDEEHLVDMRRLTWKETVRGESPHKG